MQRYNVEFFLPLMYWLWRLPAVWSLQSADEVELSGTWKGHSKLSVLGTGFPLSPINWRMCLVETHWPRGAFLSASIKTFYFSGFFFFFFFLLTFLTRKKWFGVYVTTFFFIYIPPQHWPLQRGICEFSISFFWECSSVVPKGIFHLVFATSPMSNGSCFLCKTHAADISGCDFYFFFHPSPFSLTLRPLRLGVKKCNISYRLLVWEEFLCICPDRKVLTHSEGRTQRRSGCVRGSVVWLESHLHRSRYFFFFRSRCKTNGSGVCRLCLQ